MSAGDRLARSLTGIATRRAVADYLRFTALIMFILLSIAWTIDLAANFTAVRGRATADDLPLWQVLGRYLLHRGVDIVTRLLPMAVFFGTFLAEIARRRRLETVILATAGASPWRMLAAIAIFAVLTGAVQALLESRWRPAAVAAQVETGLGQYAARFAPRWIGDVWFLSDDLAVRATVRRGPEPRMRDVLIFEGIDAPRLQRILGAETATPAGDPGRTTLWRLSGVSAWNAAEGRETSEPLPDQVLDLGVIPEQVRYSGIRSFYLPTAPVRILARDADEGRVAEAQVALWRRRTAGFLPLAMAVFAARLVQRGFSGRLIRVPRLIALAILGYLSVVSLKVMWAVGELGAVSPPAATVGTLVVILGVSAALFAREL